MPESNRSGRPRSATRSAAGASSRAGAMLVGGGGDSQAAMEEHKRKLREKAEAENATLW